MSPQIGCPPNLTGDLVDYGWNTLLISKDFARDVTRFLASDWSIRIQFDTLQSFSAGVEDLTLKTVFERYLED